LILYFLKGTSGYTKIGRTQNFDKRLSEIRRATTDEHVEVLATFSGTDDFVIEQERDLHFRLTEHRFKGEWYHDTPAVRAAMIDADREFNPENYSVPLVCTEH
jgi:hypothetical protein